MDKDNISISASRVCVMSDSHLRPGAALTCKCMKIKLQKWWGWGWDFIRWQLLSDIMPLSNTLQIELCLLVAVRLVTPTLHLHEIVLAPSSHFQRTLSQQRHNALHHNQTCFSSYLSWNGDNTMTMMMIIKQNPTPYVWLPLAEPQPLMTTLYLYQM